MPLTLVKSDLALALRHPTLTGTFSFWKKNTYFCSHSLTFRGAMCCSAIFQTFLCPD